MELQQESIQFLINHHGMDAVYRLMNLAENPFHVGLADGLAVSSKSEVDQSLLDTLGSAAPGSGGFLKGLAAARFHDEKESWAHNILEAVKKTLPDAAIVQLLLALP